MGSILIFFTAILLIPEMYIDNTTRILYNGFKHFLNGAFVFISTCTGNCFCGFIQYAYIRTRCNISSTLFFLSHDTVKRLNSDNGLSIIAVAMGLLKFNFMRFLN